jgi:hypothetical protein
MKKRIASFFLAAIATGFCQEPQKACNAGDPSVMQQFDEAEIFGLKLSLYALSQLPTKDPEDLQNMARVGREAVWALSNDFTTYAMQYENCSLNVLDKKDYAMLRGQGYKLIIALGNLGDRKDWEAALATDKKLPFRPEIEKEISSFLPAKSAAIDPRKSLQVAAAELLGISAQWDVTKFQPEKFFAYSSDENFLLSKAWSELSKKSLSEQLATVAHLYK